MYIVQRMHKIPVLLQGCL